MDLTLTDGQKLLKDSFANFLAKESGPDRVRASEPLGFDAALWDQVVAMGAITMGVSPELGGGGAAFLDLALLAQEFGRRVAPVPFIEATTTSNLLARAGATALLAEVIEGAIPTLALQPPVDGKCRLVPAGAVADIVVMLDNELVVLKRTGVRDRPYVPSPPNLGSSPIADVRIDEPGLERVVLASGDFARELYNDALVEWKILMAAALDGVRSAALELAVEYVKERKAFGVPIGWFQAIQHRLSDVTVAGDGAQLLVYEAAWARDEGHSEAAQLASMAFLSQTQTTFKTCRESLQFHGGYGYTLDYTIQLYFRRAKAWPLALGDPRREYQRLAERLFPEA